MRVAIVAAGFTAEEADQLRKSMATFKQTGGVAAWRARLVGGMVRRGYARDLAERVFSQIEGFGSYGFPESHAASFAYLAYASAWLKCHHPAAFAAALLNSQPMGFYAPAQIVRDAREHGVPVRPVDVNESEWDCTLEPAPEGAEGPAPKGAERLALRLGLRMVAGLPAEEGQAVAKARRAGNGSPFASLDEMVRRAGIGRRAVEALAAADACAGMGASLGAGRRQALWAAMAVERRSRDTPPLLRVPPHEPSLFAEPALDLPPERAGEAAVQDYLATGLTLGPHPMALLRPEFDRLGLGDTRRLQAARPGGWIRLPGLVLMRQRPGTAKGIVFVTVEDEHGEANIVVYPQVGQRDRAALVAARLLVVEGRVEREERDAEVPILHLIARRLLDRTALLDRLHLAEDGTEAGAWAERVLGHADEVRRPDPGSARPNLGRSRDFR